VCVDIRKVKGTVCGDISQLPFEDGSFDEIRCIHVLEHLTRDKHVPTLKELYRVLQPGGCLWLEVPDMEEMTHRLSRAYNREGIDYERIRVRKVAIYGKSETQGQSHHWGFDRADLSLVLRTSGFSNFEFTDEYISNHYKFDPVLLVKAKK
jgi:predicted SAM-dependent methyltransferase